jgi:small subunit ribosomal protein S13
MSREFNYIVRLHGTNIDGTKMVPYALTDVKGVGVRLARAIVKQLGLDATERLGNLGDADVKKLETAIDDPASIGLPTWMLNRRKDPMTGDDLHMIASKGERHSRGLKVRGQRTKTTGRTGRSVGVSRRSVQNR